jgi:hypothetical protein
MTPAEFKAQLDQLQELIFRAFSFYRVWLQLQFRQDTAPWSLADQNRMLDRFRGVFTPVLVAMQDAMLLQFAKLLDEDTRTISFPTLIAAARNNPSVVPNLDGQQLIDLDQPLSAAHGTSQSLKQLRNQRLAHTDANPAPPQPILKKELEGLAKAIEGTFNALSSGYDRSICDWDYAMRATDRDVEEVVGAILSHMATTNGSRV